MKKKILSVMLAGVMAAALMACGGSSSAPAAAPAAEKAEEKTEEKAEEAAEEKAEEAAESYTVGVVQLVQHPALDAATQGFQDAITEAMGDAVSFDVQNASGETANCATIVNGFVSDNVDLIMANATPPLQAAAAATADIPVLGTSVTDYATALEIDNWNGTIGNNISGTSDLAPIDQQAAMIQELFPEAETVGLLYCTAEANSVFQCEMIEGYLTEMGYSVEWYGFNDTNDVNGVTQTAADACDVIYIPTDNTAAANTEAIANVVIPAGVPVVASEEGICSGCGVATLTISYYDLGYATGKMAVKVLTGEADITEMAVEYAPNATKEYNAANCETLGITVPEDYVAIGE